MNMFKEFSKYTIDKLKWLIKKGYITLTNVKVWKMLRDNHYSLIIEDFTYDINFPYDMRIWVKSIGIKLIYEFKKTKIELEKRYDSILVSCTSTDRKEIALKISKDVNKSVLFAMLDHNHSKIDKFIWNIVKPINKVRYEKIVKKVN